MFTTYCKHSDFNFLIIEIKSLPLKFNSSRCHTDSCEIQNNYYTYRWVETKTSVIISHVDVHFEVVYITGTYYLQLQSLVSVLYFCQDLVRQILIYPRPGRLWHDGKMSNSWKSPFLKYKYKKMSVKQDWA